MKVLHKLLIVLVITAVIPTAISTVFAVAITQRSLESTSDRLMRQSVFGAVEFIDQSLREVIRTIQQGMRYADLYTLAPEQREGALTIMYLQLDRINIVSLVDENKNGITPSIYRTFHRSDDPRFARHEPVTVQDHEIYQKNIPLEQAKKGETGVSGVYSSSTGSPRMIFCLPMPPGPSGERWFLVAEISLQSIHDYVQVTAPEPFAAFIYDPEGRIILGTKALKKVHRVPPLERKHGGIVRFLVNGIEQRGAEARIALAGWGVILHQPESIALAPAVEIRNQALLWILAGLLVAIALGWAIARDLTAPLNALQKGAGAIADGDLTYRVDVKSSDELGEVSRMFNHMATELEKRREEIEKWNLELQKRVDERTRELHAMEKVADRAQRLASLTALGAGMAHEINNPLCTVLGTIQLAQKKYPEHPINELLKGAEDDANRIGEIVSKFLTMTKADSGSGTKVSMDICWVLDEVINAVEKSLKEQGISIERKYDRAHTIRGDEMEMRQVLSHILDNAAEACEGECVIEVEVDDSKEGAVRIRVADHGKGIQPEDLQRVFDPFFTTKGPAHQGLGLAVTYRIVEDLGGNISVDSAPGEGTVVEVILPWSMQETHLER